MALAQRLLLPRKCPCPLSCWANRAHSNPDGAMAQPGPGCYGWLSLELALEQSRSRAGSRCSWFGTAFLGHSWAQLCRGLPMGPSWHQQLLCVQCRSDASRCSGSKRKQEADSDAVRVRRKLWLQEGISRTL